MRGDLAGPGLVAATLGGALGWEVVVPPHHGIPVAAFRSTRPAAAAIATYAMNKASGSYRIARSKLSVAR